MTKNSGVVFPQQPMRRVMMRSGVCTAAIVFSLFGAMANAQENEDQDVSPNQSVSDRFARNFAVDGFRSGSFVLFPTITVAQIYDDNIFSAETDKTDDFIADLNAALSLRSDWDVHGVELNSNVRRLEYFDNSTESSTDYAVNGRGVFDLSRRSTATFSSGYARSTEARRTTQTVFGANPVRFDVFTSAIDVDLRQTRFREQFGVSYQRDDFDDVAAPLGANGLPTAPTPIDQDFRDRDVYAGYFRQSFRVQPTVALFAEVAGDIQEFNSDSLNPAVDQSSKGYGANVGVALDINKVARGEIGVGYQNRDYDNPNFEDISGINIDASLEYFLSDLTTVTLTASRTIQNTAVAGFSGFYNTGGSVLVEHELFRRLILVGGAEYREDNFEIAPALGDRKDKFVRFSAGANYAFRRNIVVSARFDRIDISSRGSLARAGFDQNRFRIGLQLRR